MHGLWAVEYHVGANIDPRAACYFPKGGRKHIPAAKLTELSDRAAKFSNGLGSCLVELQPSFGPQVPALYLFGKRASAASPPPPWPPA
jgi:hypothetical protein